MDKERSFEEVVRSIELSEKDVDRILEAAKLTRNEKPGMSDARFETICGLILVFMILLFMLITVFVK